MSKYCDIRQEFWRDEFKKALPYSEYLEAGDEVERAKWLKIEPEIVVPDDRKEIIGSFVRKINVLCYSGIWCGDCVRQGPMLKKLADLNDSINLHFAERVDGSQLGDELRINGAAKVPVVVFLSEDFYELGRFGDRLLTAYRRMELNSLGPVCDPGIVPPPPEEIQAEVTEWADIFWRMHIILRLAPMLRNRYND